MAASGGARVMLTFSEPDRPPEWTLLDYSLHATISEFEEKIKSSFIPDASAILLYLGKALLPNWESSCLLRDEDEVYVRVVQWKETEEPAETEEPQQESQGQDEDAVGGNWEESSASSKQKKRKKKKKKAEESPMETEMRPRNSTGKKGCLVKHTEDEVEEERPKKKVRLDVELDKTGSSASELVTETAFQAHVVANNTVDEQGDRNADGRRRKKPTCSTPVGNEPDKEKSRTPPKKKRSSNPNWRLSVGSCLEALRAAEKETSEPTPVPVVEETENIVVEEEQEVAAAEEGQGKRKRVRRRKRKSRDNAKNGEAVPVQPEAPPAASSESLRLPCHKRPSNVRMVFDSDSGDEDSANCSGSPTTAAPPGRKQVETVLKTSTSAQNSTPESQITAVAAERRNAHGDPQGKPKPDTPMPGTSTSQFKMPAPVVSAPVVSAPVVTAPLECRMVLGTDGVKTFVRGQKGQHSNNVHQLTPYPSVRVLGKAQQLNDRVSHSSVVIRNGAQSPQSMFSNGVSPKQKQKEQLVQISDAELNSSENVDGSYTESKGEECRDEVDVEMDAHCKKKLSSSFDLASIEIEDEDPEEGFMEEEEYPSANITYAGRTPKKIPRDYDKCPVLKGMPSPGSVIAYKVLELSSETYTPEVSEYREARVLAFNPETNQVTLKPLHTDVQHPRRPGKFDLVFEDEDGDGSEVQMTVKSDGPVVLTMSEVLFPREVK